MKSPVSLHNRALWSGLIANDERAVRDALTAGANPNHRRGSWTALNKSLRHCKSSKPALLLLEAGASPDIAWRSRSTLNHAKTPLMLAIAAGYLDVVDTLLSKGIEPTDRDLMEACDFGQALIVDKLLSYGILPVVYERYRDTLVAENWNVSRFGPLPCSLLKATQAIPPEEKVFRSAWSSLANCRNNHYDNGRIWNAFCASPPHVNRWAADMVAHAASSLWPEAVEQVLRAYPHAARLEDSIGLEASYPGSVIAHAISGLAKAKRGQQERQAFDVLEKLLAAGFSPKHPATTSNGSTPEGDTKWASVPLLFFATKLYRGNPSTRRRLLKTLIDAGAEIVSGAADPGRPSNQTLAHALVERNDPRTWKWLCKHVPDFPKETSDNSLLVHVIDCHSEFPSTKYEPKINTWLTAGVRVDSMDRGRNPIHALADALVEGYKRRSNLSELSDDVAKTLVLLLRAGVPWIPDSKGLTALNRIEHTPCHAVWSHILLSHSLSDTLTSATASRNLRSRL